MLFLTLIPTVWAIAVLQSSWTTSDSCSGPPDSLTVFSVQSPWDVNQPANETWPAIFSLNTPMYEYGFCGDLLVKMPDSCCVSSLDLVASKDTLSGTAKIQNNGSGYQQFPQSANGATYCHLVANSSRALFGYSEYYILADGECTDQRFSCSKSGLLSVFERIGCLGAAVSLQLTDTSELVNLAPLGLINVGVTQISSAAAVVGWTTYQPGSAMVPIYKNRLEYMGVSMQLTQDIFIRCYNSIQS